MTISAASFPTPALALRSLNPDELRRVRAFATEQAEIAELMRTRLTAARSSSCAAMRAELDTVHSDLIRWRHDLARRASGRLGQGVPLDARRFLTTLTEGGKNYDRVGYLGRLRDSSRWEPDTQTFQGGSQTPAFKVMLAYGQHVLDRFAAQGVHGDVLDNRVTLPDGRCLTGNRLVRGEAARAIASDLVARIASRGADTSRIETGGNPIYVISADDDAREAMFHSAMDLLASLGPEELPGWQAARYLLYQAPVMKKGNDAVTRAFLVAVGAVILGYPPVLDHDVDLRCLVLGQAAAISLPSDPVPVG